MSRPFPVGGRPTDLRLGLYVLLPIDAPCYHLFEPGQGAVNINYEPLWTSNEARERIRGKPGANRDRNSLLVLPLQAAVPFLEAQPVAPQVERLRLRGMRPVAGVAGEVGDGKT